MYCAVFKSLKKQDHFVYSCTKEMNGLPDFLMASLAPFEFILSLNLSPSSKLANKNPQKVLTSLLEKGFFIQLPPKSLNNIVMFNEKLNQA